MLPIVQHRLEVVEAIAPHEGAEVLPQEGQVAVQSHLVGDQAGVVIQGAVVTVDGPGAAAIADADEVEIARLGASQQAVGERHVQDPVDLTETEDLRDRQGWRQREGSGARDERAGTAADHETRP